MSSRHRFEGLLEKCMKHMARKPVRDGERAIAEIKPTFRAGFKLALIALDLIKESTTELNDKQMDILISRLEEICGEKPPTPEHP